VTCSPLVDASGEQVTVENFVQNPRVRSLAAAVAAARRTAAARPAASQPSPPRGELSPK